jgi:hypothetical protein
MSDLYVANVTQQTHVFHFRIPESLSPWQIDIRAGGQVKVPAPAGGFNQTQRDYVIEQLQRYGGVKVDDTLSGRKRVWLVWSDRPMTTSTLYKILEQNQSALKKEGEGLRQQAAIAIDAQVSQMGENVGFAPPDAIEVSMVEQESKGNPSPEFGEGLRVSKTEAPGATPPRDARGKRAARRAA